MAILVTGGAGYIGSHTLVELLEAGRSVLVYDNLSNSSEKSLQRVEEITGKPVQFVEGDILDADKLSQVLGRNEIEAVIHFAGLKAVGESAEQPLSYYQNNLAGTATLCEIMAKEGVRRLVFSSSATVYGDPQNLPIQEGAATSATNPYGRTKLFIEEMLRDLHASDQRWRIALLRYFNPIGAHPSGLIGEDPNGIPNNLFPFITQVAIGARKELSVFGNDYPTPDGTGVRDYIHVVDLARGHLAALNYMERDQNQDLLTVNLGTGQGYSVLEIINTFVEVTGQQVPYRVVSRRTGDIASCFADPGFAERTLGWKAEFGLRDMCRDGWHWQQRNPQGYKS